MNECRVGWSAVAWFLLSSVAALAADRDPTISDPSVLPAEWRDHRWLVKSSDVRLRETPDAQSPVVDFSLAGIWLHAQQFQGDWLKVEKGWLRAAEVVIDDAAVEFFTKEIQVAKSAFAYVSRARAWMFKSAFDKAQADLSEAIKLDPTNAEYLTDRAVAYCHLQHWDCAIADLTAAIDRAPRHAPAWHVRAWVRGCQREWRLALSDYDEAVRLAPTDVMALVGRVEVLKQLCDFSGMIRDCNAILTIDKKSTRAFMWRGWALHQQGRLAEAMADYAQSLVLDPDQPWTRTQLALVVVQQHGAKVKVFGAETDVSDSLRRLSGLEKAFSDLDRAVQTERKAPDQQPVKLLTN